MRILIVGEFSAFAKYLSLGFRSLGHESFIFSWGDSFKRIEQNNDALTLDISNFRFKGKDIRGSHYLKRIIGYFKLQKRINQVQKYYDCALIINPAFVKEKAGIFNPYPTIDDVKAMLRTPQLIFLSACGNDYIYNSALPYIEKAGKFNIEKYTQKLDQQRKHFHYVASVICGIIPVMITYSRPYKELTYLHNCKVYDTIPLPFDTTCKIYKQKNRKISILHGITRPKEKGSSYILEALDTIREKYKNKVEIHIVEKLPLKDYLDILSKTDILIDQCHGSSYGMNAIEALSMGKVVLSGNELGNAEEFHCDFCPVINIQPDATQIINELERLIQTPSLIEEISYESAIYAKKVHDCKIVAKQYIELFENEINSLIF